MLVADEPVIANPVEAAKAKEQAELVSTSHDAGRRHIRLQQIIAGFSNLQVAREHAQLHDTCMQHFVCLLRQQPDSKSFPAARVLVVQRSWTAFCAW